MLVIQSMKGEFNLRNFTLQTPFHDILFLKSAFSHISFMNVYMDRNYEIDKLSKDRVALENGICKIIDNTPTHSFEYIHVH
jgi:hypothetical protein